MFDIRSCNFRSVYFAKDLVVCFNSESHSKLLIVYKGFMQLCSQYRSYSRPISNQ